MRRTRPGTATGINTRASNQHTPLTTHGRGRRVRRRLWVAPLAVLALLCAAGPAQGYVYWTQGQGNGGPIGRANLDGTRVRDQLISRAGSEGIAADGAHIYFTGDYTNPGTIGRANLDGTGLDRGFIKGTGAIAIAVDRAHIYWTDQIGTTATIGRANLDGTAVNQSFIKVGTGGVYGVAVAGAHIYWTKVNGSTGTIGRANLDGTAVDGRFIAAPDVAGVAVDHAHIYWTNFGKKIGVPGTIGRANLDGTGANQRFITGATSPFGLAVDGAHLYWANYTGTIGRANLDGTGVDQRFIDAGPLGVNDIAVDALGPSAGQQTGSLRGAIGLAFAGGRVHGYKVSLGGEVGQQGTVPDTLDVVATKTTGGLTQSHDWAVKLVAGEITINRSKASVVVRDPLGPGGADGGIDFTFSGRPRTKSIFGCRIKHNMVYGTLTGTIRIKVGDHFFKTITVTRMTGWAADTYTNYCLAPCPSPYYVVSGSGPYSPAKRNVVLTAETRLGRQPSSVAVSVFDPTAGTPFIQISHVLYAARAKPFVNSNVKLTGADVSGPGGALSGSLSFKSSGRPHTTGPAPCKGGHDHTIYRSAKLTTGRITATFDSIGKFSLGSNMNKRLPDGVPELPTISRVS